MKPVSAAATRSAPLRRRLSCGGRRPHRPASPARCAVTLRAERPNDPPNHPAQRMRLGVIDPARSPSRRRGRFLSVARRRCGPTTVRPVHVERRPSRLDSACGVSSSGAKLRDCGARSVPASAASRLGSAGAAARPRCRPVPRVAERQRQRRGREADDDASTMRGRDCRCGEAEKLLFMMSSLESTPSAGVVMPRLPAWTCLLREVPIREPSAAAA